MVAKSVEEGGGGEGGGGGGARDTESKTRTPHKDVGKNHSQELWGKRERNHVNALITVI